MTPLPVISVRQFAQSAVGRVQGRVQAAAAAAAAVAAVAAVHEIERLEKLGP